MLPIRMTLAIVMTVLLLPLPAAVGARTLSVPGDAATIAGAVELAQRGDLILVACGTYREHDIVLKPGVAIWSGTLQPECAIIDAGGQGRIFDLADADSTTAIVGLTLRGGLVTGDGLAGCGGAIRLRGASPRLSKCRIIDCRARLGGAVYADSASAPLIKKTELRGNIATERGGGLYWSGPGQGRLIDCRLESNAAVQGAGMYITAAEGLPLTRCVFVLNTAANAGGALYLAGSAPVLRRSLLVGNWGGLNGGAVACAEASPRLINCTLSDNGAEYSGGGLMCHQSSPRLEYSIVAFNALTAVAGDAASRPVLVHCNLFANADGDWKGSIAGQLEQSGNFSDDPLFCNREVGNFHLRAGSSSLPGRGSAGRNELVGALGAGCSGQNVLFPGGRE